MIPLVIGDASTVGCKPRASGDDPGIVFVDWLGVA